MNVCTWFDARDVGLISHQIKGTWWKILTLIWRSRNEPWFWGSCDALLDLEINLYFDRVSIGFFSLSVYLFFFFLFFFLYEKPIFIGDSMVIDLEFSLNIYWDLICFKKKKDLITNFEFEFNFGLVFNKNFPCASFILTLPHGFHISHNPMAWTHVISMCIVVTHGLAMWVDFICWLSAIDTSSNGN